MSVKGQSAKAWAGSALIETQGPERLGKTFTGKGFLDFGGFLRFAWGCDWWFVGFGPNANVLRN